MLVDRFGEVIITNDGVTILDKMDVNHPAAKMLINIAKAQQAEVATALRPPPSWPAGWWPRASTRLSAAYRWRGSLRA
jgi:hypothetical protein